MPLYNYTVAQAIAAAGTTTGVTASVITEILGDASKAKSHAGAHMKSEEVWTSQRTLKGKSVGTVTANDEHLVSA